MKIRSDYSFSQKIRLLFWVIRTKVLFKNARLIRFPFDCRGKSYMSIGKGFTTGVGCRLEVFPIVDHVTSGYKIIIGENVQINDYVHISALEEVRIGNNVLIAGNVYISDNSHGFYGYNDCCSPPYTPPKERDYTIKPVKIGDNVWIGEGVIVLPGVSIGFGSIIGAHAVVTRDIPEKCIAVGSPAKVIKHYDDEKKQWLSL